MAKKPPTQEQRDRKNAALRAKRAAQAAAKAAPPAPAPAPVPAPKLALDEAPKPVKRAAQPERPDRGGRRSIYGEKMHTVSFKCTRQQHETFLRAGGNVYLRDRLDELTAFYAKGGK